MKKDKDLLKEFDITPQRFNCRFCGVSYKKKEEAIKHGERHNK